MAGRSHLSQSGKPNHVDISRNPTTFGEITVAQPTAAVKRPSGVLNAAQTYGQQQAPNRVRQGNQAASALGQAGAEAFRSTYTENVAANLVPQTAIKGFSLAYNAALTGETLSDRDQAAVDRLPADMQTAAIQAGQADAIRAEQATYFGENAGVYTKDGMYKQAHLSTKTFRTLDALGKTLGVEIRFKQSLDGANAQYGDGTITIALDAQDPVLAITSHEVVHRIRETAPDVYTALAEFVREHMSEEQFQFAQNVRQQTYKTDSVNALTEETIADAFGRMVNEKTLAQQLGVENRNVIQKIADVVRDIIRSIQRALHGQNVRLTDAQKQSFSDLRDSLGVIDSVFADAIRETGNRAATRETTNAATVDGDTGNVKFSRREIESLTEDDVRDLLERSSYRLFGDDTYIPLRRNTPGILISEVERFTGGETTVEDLPIAMPVEKARQAMEEIDGQSYGENEPHNLSIDDMIAIIKGMDNPNKIIYQAENDRYVEVIHFYNGNRQRTYAVFDFGDFRNPDVMNGFEGGAYHTLVTVFPPEKYKDYLSKSSHITIYDKTKSGQQRGSGGILTPLHLNRSPFADNVAQDDESVNPQNAENSKNSRSDREILEQFLRQDGVIPQNMTDEEVEHLRVELSQLAKQIVAREREQANERAQRQTLFDLANGLAKVETTTELREQIDDLIGNLDIESRNGISETQKTKIEQLRKNQSEMESQLDRLKQQRKKNVRRTSQYSA